MLSLYLPYTSLKGDIIRLNNGKKIDGFFLKENNNKIIFQDIKGKKYFINSSDVKAMKIGLSGVSACYLLIDAEDDDEGNVCEVLLVSIEKDQAIFARGDGLNKILKIRLKTLARIELKYENFPFQIFPPIRRGQYLLVTGKQGTSQGKLSTYTREVIKVRRKNGSVRSYTTKGLKKIVFQFPENNKQIVEAKELRKAKKEKEAYEEANSLFRVTWGESPWTDYFLMSRPQYLRGDYFKTGAMLGGTIILLSLAYQSYLDSVDIAAEGEKEVNRNDPEKISQLKEEFDSLIRTQKLYGYGFALLYTWHIIDVLNNPRILTNLQIQNKDFASNSNKIINQRSISSDVLSVAKFNSSFTFNGEDLSFKIERMF